MTFIWFTTPFNVLQKALCIPCSTIYRIIQINAKVAKITKRWSLFFSKGEAYRLKHYYKCTPLQYFSRILLKLHVIFLYIFKIAFSISIFWCLLLNFLLSTDWLLKTPDIFLVFVSDDRENKQTFH